MFTEIQENENENMSQPNEEYEEAIPNPDFASLESKDPSLLEGYRVLFKKEIPMDLKLEINEGQKEVSSFEGINFKVLKLHSSSEAPPNHIKIELSSENDLFFHFTSIVDEEIFKVMKDKQGLTIDYSEFTSLLEKLCNFCSNDPDNYIATFIMKKQGAASLEIIRGSEFKFLELLKLEFVNSSDEIIKKQMLYKFAALKSKIDYYKNCIQASGDIIMENNPDIIPQMLEYNDNLKINFEKSSNNK